MPAPITGIGNSPAPQAPAGGHGSHVATAGSSPAAATGLSFAATLAAVAGRAPSSGFHGGLATGGGGLGTSSARSSVSPSGHAGASGASHPLHIPLAGSAHGGGHDFQEIALGLRAYRQQLIASNIANADTPDYKAVDIDFQEALRVAQSGSSAPLSLALTSVAHIAGQAAGTSTPVPLKYHIPSQAAADGNTVEMDVERAKFAENAMMYEFSVDRVSGHYKMMSDLFNNLK